jgi:hypothetical protein
MGRLSAKYNSPADEGRDDREEPAVVFLLSLLLAPATPSSVPPPASSMPAAALETLWAVSVSLVTRRLSERRRGLLLLAAVASSSGAARLPLPADCLADDPTSLSNKENIDAHCDFPVAHMQEEGIYMTTRSRGGSDIQRQAGRNYCTSSGVCLVTDFLRHGEQRAGDVGDVSEECFASFVHLPLGLRLR